MKLKFIFTCTPDLRKVLESPGQRWMFDTSAFAEKAATLAKEKAGAASGRFRDLVSRVGFV